MSRRKPPVTKKAQREAIPESFSDLREKMKECLAELQRATRETIQPANPPASGWRSMASAPRDGRDVLVMMSYKGAVFPTLVRCISDHVLWLWENDHTAYREQDCLGWLDIPEWTGEVAE